MVSASSCKLKYHIFFKYIIIMTKAQCLTLTARFVKFYFVIFMGLGKNNFIPEATATNTHNNRQQRLYESSVTRNTQ